MSGKILQEMTPVVTTEPESMALTDVHIPLPPVDRTLQQPAEIITAVFDNVLSGVVSLPPGVNDYQWLLGHVCSRWRKILWNSTSFWIDVRVFRSAGLLGDNITIWRMKRIYESLEYIVSHTHSPLSLSIHNDDFDSLADVVFPNFHRFRNLSLGRISQNAVVSILNLPLHSLDCLESLSMWSSLIDPPLPTTSALIAAPKLHSVNYKFFSLWDSYYPELLHLPFERLTYISVQQMPIPLNVIQKILASSPLLESCIFQPTDCASPLEQSQTIMSNLNTLRFNNSPPIDLFNFFDLLSTPVLEDLEVEYPKFHIRTITSLLLRSKCSVKHLNLHPTSSSDWDEAAINSFIHQLPPSIVSLHIFWVLGGSIFKRIQRGLLPMLEKIVLFVDVDGLEALADLLNCYVKGTGFVGQSLRVVSIGYDFQQPELVAGWARPWAQIDGLSLSIYNRRTGINLMNTQV